MRCTCSTTEGPKLFALVCRFVTAMRQWKPRLIQAGIMELVFEDAQDLLIDQLNSLGTPDPMTISALESNMRDESISPMVRA